MLLILTSFALERRRDVPARGLQASGSSALTLAVLKLLLVDMAEASPLVRIPLFFGSGIALLLLSPLFQRRPRGETGVAKDGARRCILFGILRRLRPGNLN